MSERDRFLAVLATQSLSRAHAIVLLAGEDGDRRADTAAALIQQRVAGTIICAGGLHTPPRSVDGEYLARYLLGKGVAPDAVIVESGSQNTREQAVNVLDLAAANDWTRLVLVASPYHMARAFLTFVQRATETDRARDVRLLHYPAVVPWWTCPPGHTETRFELLARDAEKTAYYQALGHVATYADGLAYLRLWEGQP